LTKRAGGEDIIAISGAKAVISGRLESVNLYGKSDLGLGVAIAETGEKGVTLRK
jgi:hypothetical protein